MAFKIVGSLLLLWVGYNPGFCLPEGAPLSHKLCKTMYPEHYPTVRPQTKPSPVKFDMAEDTTFKIGDFIKVTLKSKDETPFTGLLVEARLSDSSDQIVGTFCDVGLDSNKLQTLDCLNITKSAITQSEKLDDVEKSFYFHAKEGTGITGDIFFRATIVINYETFWININSPDITLSETVSSYSDNLGRPCSTK